MNTDIAYPMKINLRNSKFKDNIFKYRKIFIAAIIILVSVLLVRNVFSKKSNTITPTDGDNRINIQTARASQDIYREFLFPLTDEKGKELTKIKYIVEKAELRDEIIVKGQRAMAVKGKTFLILSLKVTNTYDKPIQIATRDYLRLSVNDNRTELLAANIHNDPVNIQAISTQPVRLGFAIDDNNSKLVLLIGEIKGEKQEIELNLK